jgi:hypothetical protein
MLGVLIIGFCVIAVYYRDLWACFRAVAATVHNIFLLGIKCTLELPIRHPFGILSSCEARVQIIPPVQQQPYPLINDLMLRIDSIEDHIQKHISATNLINVRRSCE